MLLMQAEWQVHTCGGCPPAQHAAPRPWTLWHMGGQEPCYQQKDPATSWVPAFLLIWALPSTLLLKAALTGPWSPQQLLVQLTIQKLAAETASPAGQAQCASVCCWALMTWAARGQSWRRT